MHFAYAIPPLGSGDLGSEGAIANGLHGAATIGGNMIAAAVIALGSLSLWAVAVPSPHIGVVAVMANAPIVGGALVGLT